MAKIKQFNPNNDKDCEEMIESFLQLDKLLEEKYDETKSKALKAAIGSMFDHIRDELEYWGYERE